MKLKVIAYARNGHTDKFGIPRQSREESPIVTRIVFEPEYNVREALRGIEGFSHLWILWGFSRSHPSYTHQNNVLKEDTRALRSPQKLEIFGGPNSLEWSPTVRPPRLGGNKRVGVFATRSPFRPNPIGLSSVRNLTPTLSQGEGVYIGESGRMELIVSGADMMDGTPIYDIKPYLSFTDSHPEAVNGFAEETKNYELEVAYPHPLPEGKGEIPQEIVKEIEYILRQDPRPAYQEDPSRVYKMDYAGWRVEFRVDDLKSRVYIQSIYNVK